MDRKLFRIGGQYRYGDLPVGSHCSWPLHDRAVGDDDIVTLEELPPDYLPRYIRADDIVPGDSIEIETGDGRHPCVVVRVDRYSNDIIIEGVGEPFPWRLDKNSEVVLSGRREQEVVAVDDSEDGGCKKLKDDDRVDMTCSQVTPGDDVMFEDVDTRMVIAGVVEVVHVDAEIDHRRVGGFGPDASKYVDILVGRKMFFTVGGERHRVDPLARAIMAPTGVIKRVDVSKPLSFEGVDKHMEIVDHEPIEAEAALPVVGQVIIVPRASGNMLAEVMRIEAGVADIHVRYRDKSGRSWAQREQLTSRDHWWRIS